MPGVQEFAAPTPWTALRRLGYRCAYRLARAWWFLRRPETAGVLVALWDGPRLLLIRTSYRRQATLPGGFVGPKESLHDAATRELREEVGVAIAPSALHQAWHDTIAFESRDDTVSIFEVHLAARPVLHVDRGEVVWAAWIEPADALQYPLLPHVRRYLCERHA